MDNDQQYNSYHKKQLIESMFKNNPSIDEEPKQRRGKVRSVPPPSVPVVGKQSQQQFFFIP